MGIPNLPALPTAPSQRETKKQSNKRNKEEKKGLIFAYDFRKKKKKDFIVSASSSCFALQVLFYVQTDLVSCPLARHRGFGWINVASLIIIFLIGVLLVPITTELCIDQFCA